VWVGVTNTLHLNGTTFMHIAGAVEMAAGLLVLFALRLGAIVVGVELRTSPIEASA
jgi:hypothetical protein